MPSILSASVFNELPLSCRLSVYIYRAHVLKPAPRQRAYSSSGPSVFHAALFSPPVHQQTRYDNSPLRVIGVVLGAKAWAMAATRATRRTTSRAIFFSMNGFFRAGRKAEKRGDWVFAWDTSGAFCRLRKSADPSFLTYSPRGVCLHKNGTHM